MQFNTTTTAVAAMVGLGAVALGGCCCCRGSFTPPNFSDSFSADATSDDGAAPAVDPNADKDTQEAHKYAQQALNNTGYGDVKSVTLQKDGTNWYATGTAKGLDGADVSYNVWFVVTTFQSDNQVKTTWAVKTVTVDGEVVYP